MKRMIVLLACCLAVTCASAQEKKAYAVFDKNGRETDYGQMMTALGERDVVFIGEIHNSPVAHWMEYEIIQDLHALHQERLMIGAEMFERDAQLALDEYLKGMISTDYFIRESKAWPNYKTDYADIVEFAKANKIPVVATNIPRRYAGIVSRGGFEALNALSDEAKRYIAPLPLNYIPNEVVDAYFGAMTMPGMKQNNIENLSKSQAVKDATMAWSIAERLESKFVHLNGSFHSMAGAGIITYLNQYRPGLKIGTVEVVRQESLDKLDGKVLGHADFYICIPNTAL